MKFKASIILSFSHLKKHRVPGCVIAYYPKHRRARDLPGNSVTVPDVFLIKMAVQIQAITGAKLTASILCRNRVFVVIHYDFYPILVGKWAKHGVANPVKRKIYPDWFVEN
jgi:hypothetical protein